MSFTPAEVAERGAKTLAEREKDRRGEPVRLDERPQGRAGSDEVPLADELLERPGPHPGRKRRRPGELLGGRGVEEVLTGSLRHGSRP